MRDLKEIENEIKKVKRAYFDAHYEKDEAKILLFKKEMNKLLKEKHMNRFIQNAITRKEK